MSWTGVRGTRRVVLGRSPSQFFPGASVDEEYIELWSKIIFKNKKKRFRKFWEKSSLSRTQSVLWTPGRIKTVPNWPFYSKFSVSKVKADLRDGLLLMNYRAPFVGHFNIYGTSRCHSKLKCSTFSSRTKLSNCSKPVMKWYIWSQKMNPRFWSSQKRKKKRIVYTVVPVSTSVKWTCMLIDV